jgi:hypothetical protein
VEWPGFFAQNPLRIYAQRFGNQHARNTSEALESQIECYALHLLDVVPTVKQLAFINSESVDVKQESTAVGKFYGHAGFGIAKFGQTHLSFRASPFGNSSHRHADQGNLALMENGLGVLTPTGSYGYCFGSTHHSEWTQTTQAHNLPLVGGVGQLLDDESATATLLHQSEGVGWYCSKVDLSRSYPNVSSFIRTFVFLEGAGLVIWDSVTLPEANTLQWRVHSHLNARLASNEVELTADKLDDGYQCALVSGQNTKPTLAFGYQEAIPVSGGIESDATTNIYHIEWNLSSAITHDVVMSCLKAPVALFFDGTNTLALALSTGKLVVDKVAAKIQPH